MKLSNLVLTRKLVLIHWMRDILQSLISLIKSQIRQLVINFQHRLKTCVDHFCQWKRAYPSSMCSRYTQLPSNYTWKIQGRDQSMQKEELSENRPWRYSLHIPSSLTCSFTSWGSYTRKHSPPHPPNNIGKYLKAS